MVFYCVKILDQNNNEIEHRTFHAENEDQVNQVGAAMVDYHKRAHPFKQHIHFGFYTIEQPTWKNILEMYK